MSIFPRPQLRFAASPFSLIPAPCLLHLLLAFTTLQRLRGPDFPALPARTLVPRAPAASDMRKGGGALRMREDGGLTSSIPAGHLLLLRSAFSNARVPRVVTLVPACWRRYSPGVARRREEGSGCEEGMATWLGGVNQQRPARKLPSLLVDPAEEGVRRRCRDPINVESLLPSKIRINLDNNIQYVSMRKTLKVKRPRFDVSLVYLTRKFMDLVRSAPGGILDLNKVATKLGVRKRRVYDITNVLDGIDLVEKKSKNHIRWIGSDLNDFGALPQQKKLQEELSDLATMEDALDELIKNCAQQLYDLIDDKENERLAYVTYQDIHSIQAFHEQIVIAVKAPAETRLDVPAPREDSITVHIRSTNGPIDVYLCEVEQENASNKVQRDGGTSSSENKSNEEENPPQQSEGSHEVTD
ncbi:PREDICTED: transcription factor E2F6-like [Elephantulus edwardii]|uniref:transcription factor E2F6-like n=1 Tax=Elephantulus edwardii TaxID=28737 RepID=UPI0003F06053|nr:PREDICTED: transcription factor E2F6-like [Elephantulus edwardii]